MDVGCLNCLNLYGCETCLLSCIYFGLCLWYLFVLLGCLGLLSDFCLLFDWFDLLACDALLLACVCYPSLALLCFVILSGCCFMCLLLSYCWLFVWLYYV